MNTTGTAILTHPSPCGHIVYPYRDEAQLVDAVALYVGTGLRNGESALLLMQDSHCEPIRRHLQESGFNVSELESSGKLICETAEDLLPAFLFDGIIDEHKFKKIVGDLIGKAKGSSSTGQVRVFGEIVDLLWMPEPKATARLEELWNDLIKHHSVPLLCAYALGGTRPDALHDSLLACHSEAL
ncbi:MAG: MEDS domain-containing protein [Bryobacteraceae bacterium]